MIDRDVFLAAAKAIRTRNFDAIDEDTGRIDVIVDGAHRSVDVAEMLVWLVAEADVLRDALVGMVDATEKEGRPRQRALVDAFVHSLKVLNKKGA
jgi:hypothetical protein